MASRRVLYLIPALAVLVYCAAMLWGVHRLGVQRDAIEESSRTSAWIASQAAFERQRFLSSLDRYALGDPAVSHDDVVLRFDLFWSRVPLLVSGSEAQKLRQIPRAGELVEELRAALERIEPLVQGLRPGPSDDYRTIRAEMDRFGAPLHDLMLTTMGRGDLGPQSSAVEEAFRFVQLSYFAVLVIGGAAIVVIFWLTARGMALQRAQRQAADEAEAERGRLRDAIESISDGFIYYDSDQRLVHCNERYREFYPWIDDVLVPGARLEDVARAAAERGQDAEPITDPEAWVRQRMQDFLTGREGHEQHLRDDRWLLCSESRTRDGGLVGIRTDITERKRSEKELKDSEQLFSKAFHASPALFAISRPEDGAHYDVNETWMRTLDYTHEEAMAHSAHELGIWASLSERARFVKRLEKERSVRGFEAKFRTKSGEELDFLVSGEYVEIGGEARLFVVSHDITERKHAEVALRDSAQRLQDIAEAASDWFWELDAELRFTYVSDRYEEVAGMSPEAFFGKRPEQVYPRSAKQQPELWEKYFAAVGAHEDFRDFVHDDFRQDDQRRVISNTGKAVFAADGSFAGYRGSSTDITEMKEMQSQLHQAQKMETVGQLTGGVAHDFNNLLAVIMGNAELLAARSGGEDRSAQSILRAATRGAELTQRLLAFSRRQPLHPQVIDLGELVTGMTDLLQRTLGETIVIGTTCADGLWPAEADPGQVENALLNLAVNARDAMPDGGKLIIESANASLGKNYAASHPEATPGDYVMLSVSDTGSGMTPEVLDHAFEPFFTTKVVGAGSGLGLSMVYGFAKQSGGEVAIDSEPGEGTTVKLYLPRAQAFAAVATQDVAAETPKARGETVLVVEDDPDVRTLAEAVLEDLGYRVLTAANGQAGLATLEGSRGIDLLLSDVVLTGALSGPALAQQARRGDAGLKVLFMSGYADSAAQHRTSLPENAQLLNKPFRRRQLAQRVREVLDQEIP